MPGQEAPCRSRAGRGAGGIHRHYCGVLRHLPMAMALQAPRGDAGLGPGLAHVGKAAARAAKVCRELSELPKQTVAGRVSSEVETLSGAAPQVPHLPPPPAPRNSAAGVVSISINQLPPDNLGSFKHQYPKRQREGGTRWLHLPARSGAAPSPHRHGNGGVMEGRGHSGCRTHEGPFSNHSEGRKAEGNRLLFCRVPAFQGGRRATTQRWVFPEGKEQAGSCWEVRTTLSPPGPPSITPQYSGAGWERSRWHQPSVGLAPSPGCSQGCSESLSPTCARE